MMSARQKRKAWFIEISITAITILTAWFSLDTPAGDEGEILISGMNRFGISILLAIVILGVLSRLNVKTIAQRDKVGARFNLLPVQLFLFFLVILISGLRIVHFSFIELFDKDGFEGAGRLFSGMAEPKIDLIPTAIVNMVETLFMAFIATLIAVPIAFVISFFAARNLMNHSATRALRHLIKFVLNLISSVEALIWAIIFSVWVGIGPFAGVLALTVQSIVSLARGFSELIEVSSPGPIEGIRATGANQIQVVWFGILPQVFLPFLSATIYRWDINIRMATIVGLVGGGGIGTLTFQNLGQGKWHELGSIVLVIALTIWILDFISSYAREHLK